MSVPPVSLALSACHSRRQPPPVGAPGTRTHNPRLSSPAPSDKTPEAREGGCAKSKGEAPDLAKDSGVPQNDQESGISGTRTTFSWLLFLGRAHLTMLRVYSWLCTQGSHLRLSGEHYGQGVRHQNRFSPVQGWGPLHCTRAALSQQLPENCWTQHTGMHGGLREHLSCASQLL